MRRRLMLIGSVLSLSACASSPAYAPVDARPTRDVLLAAEIVSARVVDAYQAVSQLRPEFLKHRGPGASQAFARGALRVYLDNFDLGGIETLRTVPIENVTLIRYLSAADATFRWGINHTGGVILVSTNRYGQ
jgi:hypothetical protein